MFEQGEFDVVKSRSWRQFQTIFHIVVKELGNILLLSIIIAIIITFNAICA